VTTQTLKKMFFITLHIQATLVYLIISKMLFLYENRNTMDNTCQLMQKPSHRTVKTIKGNFWTWHETNSTMLHCSVCSTFFENFSTVCLWWAPKYVHDDIQREYKIFFPKFLKVNLYETIILSVVLHEREMWSVTARTRITNILDQVVRNVR
jgi:hypothetical protein